MELFSNNFKHEGPIPGTLAFAVPDPVTHVKLSSNRNPHLRWTGAPQNAKSFALICDDDEVPSVADDVNKEGRVISRNLPRIKFFHWVLVDIPAAHNQILEGEFSGSVTPRGKKGPAAPHGTRQGINDYTKWFGADKDMAGNYFGYDGPCPPWNDELMHFYVFTLYALDVPTLAVSGNFTAADALKAMEGHVLASAKLTGSYTLNPSLRA